MRDIGGARHASSEYVQANIFLEGESNSSPTMIKISRDIHLVKNLGTKMLLEIDILGLESAVVDLPAQRLRLGENISYLLTIQSLGSR